jgi:hypothetical protein
MKSPRGFLAAVVFLSALPLTILYQKLFGSGAEIFIHFALAAGSLLISFAVFDFSKAPKWINWLGCVSTGGLAAIFLLQGIGEYMKNEALTYFVYEILGQWLETCLQDLFFVFWCAAILLVDSRGKTRILGFIATLSVVCLEAYKFRLAYLGTSLNVEAPGLKLLYLLPFVWILFESKKKSLIEHSIATI